MQAATKRFRLTFGILSLGYILLSVMLFAAPTTSQQIICTVLGVVAIIGGLLRIALFLLRSDPSRAFTNDLAVGAVLLMGGIYLIANHAAVWSFLPVILGFTMVFDSIVKLQYGIELRRTAFTYWWVVIIISLATTVLAAMLVLGIFKEDFLHYFWATTMIIDGVANLAIMVMLTLRLKKLAGGKGGKPAKKRPRKEKERDTEAAADTAEAVDTTLEDVETSLNWNDEI